MRHVGPRVLVVEDDPVNRELITHFLEQEGCEVLEAETGEAGLERAAAEQPDLILMDLHLPDLTGYEVTRRLKADPATRATPVVALTAFALRGDEARGREAGCDGYLTKPVDLQLLRGTLRRFLAPGFLAPGGRGHRPEATQGTLPLRWQGHSRARFPVRAPAVAEPLGAAAGPYLGEVQNLSQGGMGLRLVQALVAGTAVRVTLQLRQRPPLTLTGRVVWAQPQPDVSGWALGIRFGEELPGDMVVDIADEEFPPWAA